MKNLIFVLAILFANFAQAQDSLVIYFNAQSAELSFEDMDRIDDVVTNATITAIHGWANQLPNTRTNQDNWDLARQRAEMVAEYANPVSCELYRSVAISNLASDRRVVIYYTVSEAAGTMSDVEPISVDTMDIQYKEVVLAEDTSIADTFVHSGTFAAQLYIEKVNKDTATLVALSKETRTKIDSIFSAKKAELEPTADTSAFIEVIEVSPCECVNQNTQLLWKEYKTIQRFAKSALRRGGRFSEEYLALTRQATQTRICWEFSRGLRSTKAKLERHCQECAEERALEEARVFGSPVMAVVVTGKVNITTAKAKRKHHRKVMRSRRANKRHGRWVNFKHKVSKVASILFPYINC